MFVDKENLAESIQPVFKDNPPGQHIHTVSPLSDQIVHSFVVVQDGTAIISVVLQKAAVAKRAGI